MLIDDLHSPILTAAIRAAVRHRQRAVAAGHIASILNVLSRSQVPQLTHTALMVMPWIDSDTAAGQGNIWLLDLLHQKLPHAPFNRPIQYTHRALGDAGGFGHFHVLEWWKKHVGLPKYGLKGVMDQAATRGRLDVIEWWAQQLPLHKWERQRVLQDIAALAAQHGHMHILSYFGQAQEHGQWTGNLEADCLTRAVVLNRVDILDWFLDRMHITLDPSSLKFPGYHQRMIHDAMVVACALGNQRALDKLLDRFGQAFSPAVAAFACVTGIIAFIEYCAGQLSSDSIDSPLAYHLAAAFGHVHVIDWLEAHQVAIGAIPTAPFGFFTMFAKWYEALAGFASMAPLVTLFQMTNSSDAQSPLLAACATGRVDILERKWEVWGGKSVRDEAVQVASEFNQACILDWLHRCGHIDASVEDAVLFTDCVYQASVKGHVRVLQWWHDSGLTDMSEREPLAVHGAVTHGQVDALEWWTANVPSAASPTVVNGSYWGELAESATEAGQANVLERIFAYKSQDLLKYRCSAVLFDAAQHTTPQGALLDTLWWWMHSDLDASQVQLYIGGEVGECAAIWNTLLLDMCKKAGFLRGDIDLDVAVAVSGSFLVLEWAARCSDMELVYTEEALSSLTSEADIPILDWWKQSKLPVKFAAENLQVDRLADAVREWWLTSGLL